MARFNPLQPDENALPPEEVRFLDVHVEPWPDGHRVRVHITLTPFQQPPDLELSIFDARGREVSHTTIIENIDDRFIITMHLRDGEPRAEYRLEASLGYRDRGNNSQSSCVFQLPPETPQ